jgi:hypothetical protein
LLFLLLSSVVCATECKRAVLSASSSAATKTAIMMLHRLMMVLMMMTATVLHVPEAMVCTVRSSVCVHQATSKKTSTAPAVARCSQS